MLPSGVPPAVAGARAAIAPNTARYSMLPCGTPAIRAAQRGCRRAFASRRQALLACTSGAALLARTPGIHSRHALRAHTRNAHGAQTQSSGHGLERGSYLICRVQPGQVMAPPQLLRIRLRAFPRTRRFVDLFSRRSALPERLPQVRASSARALRQVAVACVPGVHARCACPERVPHIAHVHSHLEQAGCHPRRVALEVG